ncbi:glycosyltransferase family 39 protein [Parapedobacter sp.]
MTKGTTILIGFVALKLVLQAVLIDPVYELHRDEFLHLDQANHLAWGYVSVPPVTSWISFVIKVLGNSVFWVKFFPATFGALTIVVVWKTIGALGGNLLARSLGATCVLFSALLRLNTLYQPNSLDILAWTAFYAVAVLYLRSEKQKWLYMGAVVFAIGFLNKYNIAFLLIGLLPAILMTPARKVFTKRAFYGAVVLAALIVLPNLWWQYRHGFPVMEHMKELSETQLVHVDRWSFLMSQILFFLGSLPVIAAGLYGLLRHPTLAKYIVFFWMFFITLAVFVYFRAKDYYAIGLYPIYIAFGSVYLGDVLRAGWRRYWWPVLMAIPPLLFIPMYRYFFPNERPEAIVQQGRSHRWEDGKDHLLPQDYADMLGWKELARKVDHLYAKLCKQGKTLVLCDNYGQAGAINFYTAQGIKAVSFSADYINWFDLDTPYRHMIRIKDAAGSAQELAETAPYFQMAIKADSVINPFARERGTTIFVFTDAKIDINKRISEELTEGD